MKGVCGQRGKERTVNTVQSTNYPIFCQHGSNVIAFLAGWSQLCQVASHVDAESWKHVALIDKRFKVWVLLVFQGGEKGKECAKLYCSVNKRAGLLGSLQDGSQVLPRLTVCADCSAPPLDFRFYWINVAGRWWELGGCTCWVALG